MASIKCRCGVYTQNGLFCTNCAKGSSIEALYYTDDFDSMEEEDELVEDIEGLTILDDIDVTEEEDD